MSDIIPNGTEVEVVAHSQGLLVGERFIVADYVTAEQAEDGIAFYWGNKDGGYNNVTAAANAVEVRRSRTQLARRKPPSLEELARAVASGLHSGDLQVDETTITEGQVGKKDTVEVRGVTHAGLPFYAEVRVVCVYEDDW